MRYILGCFLICILSGCTNKSEEEFTEAPVSHLIGSWQLTATRISPGNEVDWSPSEQTMNYTFQSDDTYTYANSLSDDGVLSGAYSLMDNKITTTYIPENGEPITRSYFYLLSTSELILNYIGCIESCSLRFRKSE